MQIKRKRNKNSLRGLKNMNHKQILLDQAKRELEKRRVSIHYYLLRQTG